MVPDAIEVLVVVDVGEMDSAERSPAVNGPWRAGVGGRNGVVGELVIGVVAMGVTGGVGWEMVHCPTSVAALAS